MKTNPTDPINPCVVVHEDDVTRHNGLTKHEHFAAMAIQGFLAAYPNYEPDPKDTAEKAVKFADALIKALNKEEQ